MTAARWTSCRGRGAVAAAVVVAFLLGVAAPASASVGFGTSHDYCCTGALPLGVATGDFNEDGSPDVVTADANESSTTLFLNNGFGGFSQAFGWPMPAASGAQSLVTGDFNEDGHKDIASANRTNNSVTIQLGDGGGGLLSTSVFGVSGGNPQPFFIAKGDFNEDGHTDLVTANQNTNNVALLLGDGTVDF